MNCHMNSLFFVSDAIEIHLSYIECKGIKIIKYEMSSIGDKWLSLLEM